MIWPVLAEQVEDIQADTWMDIIARIVDGAPALVAAVASGAVAIGIARKGAARHDETAEKVDNQAKSIAEIRESTVNSHARPLRYDVDDVVLGIDEVKALAETLGSEVRGDRIARRLGDKHLAKQVEDLAAQVQQAVERIEKQDQIAKKHHPEDML